MTATPADSRPRDAVGRSPQERRSQLRRATIGAVLGSTVEWYDFFIYGTASALIFNHVFFADLDPALGTIMSLLTFAVGFLARPIGAVIFGHVGDRFGRRRAFTWSLLVMGTATVLIGCLPDATVLGGGAAILLVTLRIIQGIGVGGEWGGSVLVVTENAPPRWRAFFGVAPQMGSPLGTILANGAFILVAAMPEGDRLAWGWRIPFLASAVLIIVGIMVRRTIDETEQFAEATGETGSVRSPVKEALVSAWGRILLVAGSRILELTGFTVATVFIVGYVANALGRESSMVTTGVLWGGVSELVTLPLFALIMLKYRPKHLIYWAVGLGLAFLAPFFLLINLGEQWSITLAMVIWFPIISLPFAAYPTLFGDLFDERIRYASMSIGFNIAGIVSGLAPALLTGLFAATGSWIAVAVVLAIGMLVTLGCVLGMQARTIREGSERDRAHIDDLARRSETRPALEDARPADAHASPAARPATSEGDRA